MNFHRRRFAGRAHRRPTLSRRRPITIIALALLPLLAAACGSDRATDQTAGTPTSSAPLDVTDSAATDGGGTATEPVAAGTASADDDESEPDYTADELESLLDTPPTDTDVLDAPEAEPLDPGEPAAVIEAVEDQLDPTTARTATTEILDRVQPLDDGPTGEVIGIRDGRSINEAGEANRLDEAAALACANVEIALTALDDGDSTKAVDRLGSASTLAADTSIGAMNPWAALLDEAATGLDTNGPSDAAFSTLLAFLTTCTQGGYEL